MYKKIILEPKLKCDCHTGHEHNEEYNCHTHGKDREECNCHVNGEHGGVCGCHTEHEHNEGCGCSDKVHDKLEFVSFTIRSKKLYSREEAEKKLSLLIKNVSNEDFLTDKGDCSCKYDSIDEKKHETNQEGEYRGILRMKGYLKPNLSISYVLNELKVEESENVEEGVIVVIGVGLDERIKKSVYKLI